MSFGDALYYSISFLCCICLSKFCYELNYCQSVESNSIANEHVTIINDDEEYHSQEPLMYVCNSRNHQNECPPSYESIIKE